MSKFFRCCIGKTCITVNGLRPILDLTYIESMVKMIYLNDYTVRFNDIKHVPVEFNLNFRGEFIKFAR